MGCITPEPGDYNGHGYTLGDVLSEEKGPFPQDLLDGAERIVELLTEVKRHGNTLLAHACTLVNKDYIDASDEWGDLIDKCITFINLGGT